jgi:hypothetical protein
MNFLRLRVGIRLAWAAVARPRVITRADFMALNVLDAVLDLVWAFSR